MKNLPIIDILVHLPIWLWLRLRTLLVISRFTAIWISESFSSLKTLLVSRMFWGRGSLYKNSFHILIAFVSGVALLTGIASKIQPAEAQGSFLAVSNLDFDQDFLQQGSSLESVAALDPTIEGFQAKIVKHTVGIGEDVESVANKYGVSSDTVRWANIDLIGPFSNYLEIGWQLQIPQINGILHEVSLGDSLEEIVGRTGGNLFEVREINDLQPPDYALKVGQRIFIPSGNPEIYEGELSPTMLKDAFEDPLSNPKCAGYTFYGGFTATHNGLDLVKGYGCPIRAVAAGVVKHAGWWGKGGNTVIIDHGGGIETHYYHGNGEMWVKGGERVKAGQDIMYMGTSGNSSGTHLHFSIFNNGVAFDPTGYVPYTIINPW